MQKHAIRPVHHSKKRVTLNVQVGYKDMDIQCGLCENAELGEVGAEARVMKCPEEPSAEEVARHFAIGHPHFQSWCPHCVRGRGESAPHRRGNGEAGGIPQLCLDYMTMGDRGGQA